MGQHRVQRQILQNFSFEGRQRNARDTWWLSIGSHQPTARSIRRIGFFEVDCSKAVDDYITNLENQFKDIVQRFGDGDFRQEDVGRETYNFIAMHYVRSLAFRRQIQYVVENLWSQGQLSQPQGEDAYKLLTAYRDVNLFDRLVNQVSAVLTNYMLHPIVNTGARSFVTSDKIMYASRIETDEKETVVWFPLSPSTGLFLKSDGHVGQLLGPFVHADPQSGRVTFLEVPEAPWLRCQEPIPHDVEDPFVNTVNGMMVQASKELYAKDRTELDIALKYAMTPTGFNYAPAELGGQKKTS